MSASDEYPFRSTVEILISAEVNGYIVRAAGAYYETKEQAERAVEAVRKAFDESKP